MRWAYLKIYITTLIIVALYLNNYEMNMVKFELSQEEFIVLYFIILSFLSLLRVKLVREYMSILYYIGLIWFIGSIFYAIHSFSKLDQWGGD